MSCLFYVNGTSSCSNDRWLLKKDETDLFFDSENVLRNLPCLLTTCDIRGSSISLNYVKQQLHRAPINTHQNIKVLCILYTHFGQVYHLFWRLGTMKHFLQKTNQHLRVTSKNKCETSNSPANLWALWYRLAQPLQGGPDEQTNKWDREEKRRGKKKEK